MDRIIDFIFHFLFKLNALFGCLHVPTHLSLGLHMNNLEYPWLFLIETIEQCFFPLNQKQNKNLLRNSLWWFFKYLLGSVYICRSKCDAIECSARKRWKCKRSQTNIAQLHVYSVTVLMDRRIVGLYLHQILLSFIIFLF